MLFVRWTNTPVKRMPSGMISPQIERAKQVQLLLSQGRTVKMIAEDFGITQNAVRCIIRSYGLKIKKNSP